MDLSNPIWQTIPATSPPTGVESNFVNPHSLANTIIIVNAVFLGLMMVAVVFRFFSKKGMSRQKYDWSDGTCFIATLGSIAHTGLTIHNTTINYGRHLWDIPVGSISTATTRQYSSVDIIYVVTSYFIKISILLLLYRLFKISTSALRAIYFGIGFITLLTVPYLTISIIRVIRCAGIAALSVTICKNNIVSTTNIVFGVFNVLTDFYILAIPVSQLSKLQIPFKKKMGVMALFLVGFIACSMSIVRLAIIADRFDSRDTLYTAASVSPYSAMEMKLAIICSCVVYFPPFFRVVKSSLSTVYRNLSGSFGSSKAYLQTDGSKGSSENNRNDSCEKTEGDSMDQNPSRLEMGTLK